MKNKINAYKEVLEIINKYGDIFEGLSKSSATTILKNLEALDRLGIDLPSNQYLGSNYINISYNEGVSTFGGDTNRDISWSDDGSQPQGEILYLLTFPTGAYSLHQDYPTETFNKFFKELKSFGPRYCDTNNRCLYFDETNASLVYKSWKGIFEKYSEEVEEELKDREIQELQDKLNKLKEN